MRHPDHVMWLNENIVTMMRRDVHYTYSTLSSTFPLKFKYIAREELDNLLHFIFFICLYSQLYKL